MKLAAASEQLGSKSTLHSPTAPFGNWSPQLVSHQPLLVFSEALISLSYPGGKKWSSGAVTLRPRREPILFSRQAQPACICLPSGEWCSRKDSHLHRRR